MAEWRDGKYWFSITLLSYWINKAKDYPILDLLWENDKSLILIYPHLRLPLLVAERIHQSVPIRVTKLVNYIWDKLMSLSGEGRTDGYLVHTDIFISVVYVPYPLWLVNECPNLIGSTLDPWTTWGLRVLTLCAVKNPCVTFNFPKT